jgi:hypothetical protein
VREEEKEEFRNMKEGGGVFEGAERAKSNLQVYHDVRCTVTARL